VAFAEWSNTLIRTAPLHRLIGRQTRPIPLSGLPDVHARNGPSDDQALNLRCPFEDRVDTEGTCVIAGHRCHLAIVAPQTVESWCLAPRSTIKAYVVVEGWRGAVVHRVEFSSTGKLARAKTVGLSFFARPALSATLTATIVPDIPLDNESFNLSYARNDPSF